MPWMHRRGLLSKGIVVLIVLLVGYLSFPAVFKKILSIKEPTFISPLRKSGEVSIRADAMGDGRFGSRRSNGARRHKGLDITGYVGEPVFAAKSGLAEIGEVPHGMGKYVKISHPDGNVTIYGHLSSINVRNKSWVWQGQKVGEMGKTGNANYKNIEPHLHFEIRHDGIAQDPTPYIGNKR